jgi:hypothetical protein
VGTTGSIRFGPTPNDHDVDAYGRADGGIVSAIGRFDHLADVGGRLGAHAPAVCVFLKPRMSGPHYVRELADRVVITWDLTEPFGSLLDFSWSPTINLFQAVLHRDGSIEMSYKTMAAKDGIVGIYPVLSAGERLESVGLSAVIANPCRPPQGTPDCRCPAHCITALLAALLGQDSTISLPDYHQSPRCAQPSPRLDGPPICASL